ncbi:MAG: hypothetical protein J1F11_09055 [Oscillospiraceae bacterium]|nr:hypothetical protein [Oscillospiraceae bacterium]
MKFGFNKMRIASLLCAAAMLAGCSGGTVPEETSVNVNETLAVPNAVSEKASKPKASEKSVAIDEEAELYIPENMVGEAMLDELMASGMIFETELKVMSDENAEKLEEAFENIRINNSRFALPMMIMALPEGFAVKIDYKSKSSNAVTEDGYYLYSGELYTDGEVCAHVFLILKDGAKEKYGIIIGFGTLMSSECKWSFDSIEYSNDAEKIIDCFGEPSFYANDDDMSIMAYVTNTGMTAMFIKEINAMMCFTFDVNSTINNSLLAEYVPYDDFDGIPDIPNVSGETRSIDWNSIFDDDCIIIGNDKYPALTRIGDLGDDIVLFDRDIGISYENNDNYLSDKYILMYKGREIGLINALRKKNEQPEDGIVSSWMLTDVMFPAGVMGIPFWQSNSSISRVYIPDAENGSIIRYAGIAENDSESYMCTLASMNNYMLMLSVTPASADPEGFKSFLD